MGNYAVTPGIITVYILVGGGETACLIGNAYYEFLNKLHDPSEYIRDPTHTHPQRQTQTVEIRQTGQCFPFPK